ncbi:hypothetical protein M422DRAFT_252903 [Sphaerobolus stellatus SS14]|uniref:Uncharacterized protein n=1 Tax=Sphaerobolus stellatus (strain SS14) TaxID=990650 RepID=A0A0C9VNP4_SPHS4|nr:hypothetical protein M422DRAFT_252903 [Sphaerobolus stellatus SS14]
MTNLMSRRIWKHQQVVHPRASFSPRALLSDGSGITQARHTAHFHTPNISHQSSQISFENDEWENWLASESAVYTNWRFKKEIPQAKSNHKQVYEWKRLYEGNHAGSPRNHQDDNVSPKREERQATVLRSDVLTVDS